MLPKKFRLNLKTQFKFVASGQKISDKLFNIFFRFGENQEVKIGVAVSKNTFKKAVERNKAKRLVFRAFTNFYKNLPQNLNLIVVPRGEILSFDSEEITEKLKEDIMIHHLLDEKSNN